MKNQKQIPGKLPIGLLILAFSLYWIWRNTALLIVYDMINTAANTTSDNVNIIFNIFLGIIGIPIGIQMIRGKLNIKIGVIICLLLVIVGFVSLLI
jgi:fucose permease